MKRFYEQHELTFTIIMIVIYSVGQSFAFKLNKAIGVGYSANAILNVVLSIFLLTFILKSGLAQKMGLCKTAVPARRFLWFVPLVIVSTQNFWNGIGVSFHGGELICYIVYMFCVGIVEELLFRGLLFRVLEKDNLKLAILISSVTFGIGHFINLINGVSDDVIVTLCQVVGAVAIGFLYVVIFYRGGSIIPCILSHSAIDVLSAFANEAGMSSELRMILSLVHLVLVVAYALILSKTLPKKPAPAQSKEVLNG